MMQRIINDPDQVVEDMLKGFVKAHNNLVVPTGNNRVLKYKQAPVPGKVGIVTGGGSGHKPAFIGYIGRNMVDAVAVGEIFSSPTAKAFYDAFKAADSGQLTTVLISPRRSHAAMNASAAASEAASRLWPTATVVTGARSSRARSLSTVASSASVCGTGSVAVPPYAASSTASINGVGRGRGTVVRRPRWRGRSTVMTPFLGRLSIERKPRADTPRTGGSRPRRRWVRRRRTPGA